MEIIKGMYSGLRDWYGTLNPATLSGAIDIVVVEQPDGSLACSPFHVRFGKMGVLRSTEKVVDIEINGQPVNLYMKLGDNGEAFFVEETNEEEESVPANLATSPIHSDLALMEEGIRRLHAGELNRGVAEKPIERQNDSSENSGKRSNDDVGKLLKYIKEPHDAEDMRELEKLVGDVEVTVETEVGRGKDKRQLRLTGSLKGKEDTDSQSSLDDSSRDNRYGRQISDDSTTGIPSSNQKARTKFRKKRKRDVKRNISSSLSSTDMTTTWRQGSLSDSDGSFSSSDELDNNGMFTMEDVDSLASPRVPPIREPLDRADPLKGISAMTSEDWSAVSLHPSDRIFHVFSEGDMTPLISPETTRPPTPKSDTELETNNRPFHISRNKGSISDTEKIEWNWGELPEVMTDESHTVEAAEASPESKKKTESSQIDHGSEKSKAEEEKDRKSLWSRLSFRRGPQDGGTQGGMYLDDLASDAIDPEVYALYFPERRLRHISQDLKDEDKSSDLGASLPQSPNTVEFESPPSLDDLRFCNDIQMSLCGGLEMEIGEVPMDKFNQHIISFDKFSSDPIILSNPNLVVRIGGKFYTWQVAGPILMSMLAFQRPLPDQTVTSLMKDQRQEEGGRRSFTEWLWPRKMGSPRKGEVSEEQMEGRISEGSSKDEVVVNLEDEVKQDSAEIKEDCEDGSVSGQVKDILQGVEHQRQATASPERYKKSIRLSSEELKKLNLKPGPNHVCFSVTTRYQGTTQCQATIYLWRYDSKIIVSDIDGTITKSDVFGQILPVIGKDWTHSGVAKLYDALKKNGYEFAFLSARAIGQSKVTKDYLKGICQDSLSLPDGPLLLNPSSLLRALHREVIIKKPEEFKIRCLKDIQSLFPSDDKGSPFYAGFGNRINDTWAYRAVGIPSARVFTINPQGKVTHEFTKSFQTSYPRLRDLTDQLFPPIDRRDRVTLVEPGQYSNFTYWRQPLPEINVDAIVKK
ncbi:phosphatidate phosphatase LPIN3-like isoform X2 [Apostichopus japonicus]|uniref:phosphatidate phosphatase LPIN3-like isoform X2 n=1 Tax=Stichopus japonicus TaxID=307972 RepID=UPI003AB78EC8